MAELYYEDDQGSFIVSYRRALQHHMPASHFHNNYEIYYLISGGREFFIQDRTIAVQEGDVIIIPPNMLHRTTNAPLPEHERLIVNIHQRHITSLNEQDHAIWEPLLEPKYRIIRSSLQERLLIEDIARLMKQEMEEQKPGFELYARTLTLQLLLHCCRHLQNTRTEPPAYLSPMHERISEVVGYINRHYTEELSLHLVAERFYISPFYLSRFFKEATGFTFVEYVNSVRIKEAKKLLEHTGLKVAVIAAKVGFGSVAHFGRVFKAVTGHAPLHYRTGR